MSRYIYDVLFSLALIDSYVHEDERGVHPEVEFIFEMTSSFMKHLVKMSIKG